jgi:quinone-modifying oxidoreductase subunit QmoA
MGSLKQINYVKEQYPDAQVSMYYIDIRAMGYLEDFLVKVQEMDGVSLIKGKVAKITEVANGNLKLEVEDIAAGNKINPEVDMVVLATGLVPTKIPGDIKYDEYGFVSPDNVGIVGAGCAKKPTDVSNSVMDATGATIKAIQSVVGGGA